MICKKCKNQLPEDSRFCQFCGNSIIQADPAPDRLPPQDVGEPDLPNNVVRGVKRVAVTKVSQATGLGETPVEDENPGSDPLLERAFLFLEDGHWARADEYCEKVLDREPKNPRAYLGKLMSQLHVKRQEELKFCREPFDQNEHYRKILRFGDQSLKAELAGYIEQIYTRREKAQIEDIYNLGRGVMATAKKENEFEKAAQLFESILPYKDAAFWVKECRKNAQIAKQENERITKRNIWICITAAAVLCVTVSLVFLANLVIIPNYKYNSAVALLKKGDTLGAAGVFYQLGDYKDAPQRSNALWAQITGRGTISAGNQHTVGVKTDGTVVAVGAQEHGRCNVSDWTDIVAVSAGTYHTVGLKEDGTVVATGENGNGQCDVSGWTDIVAVSAGALHTVGLKADGTVVATGQNEDGQGNVSGWTDIVAVSAGSLYTVGLKEDGTVVAAGYNNYGQCDVSGWTDIVAISASSRHTVGLRADGTVVAVGNYFGSGCDVSDWTDVVAVSTGVYHTVGLKADGTMVATGENALGQCNVSAWTDIVAVSAGAYHTVGLKADGTVVAAGRNAKGRCNVSEWEDIMINK